MMMRAWWLVAAAAAAAAQSAGAEEGIIEARPETLDGLTKEGLVLVYFYATWSGHCKRFDKEYRQAAKDLRNRARLVRINAPRYEQHLGRFRIKKFPSLRVFVDGELLNEGMDDLKPTASSIVDWVSHAELSVHEVSTPADVQQVKKYGQGMVVVGYMNPEDPAHAAAAKVMRQLSFTTKNALATAKTPAFLKGSGVTVEPPAIVVFREAVDEVATYKPGVTGDDDAAAFALPYLSRDAQGRPVASDDPHPETQVAYDFTLTDVRRWLQLAAMPVVGEITEQSYPYFVSQCKKAGGLALGWLFTGRDEAGAALRAAALKVGKALRRKIVLGYSGKRALQHYKAEVGMSGDVPAFFINAKGDYYTFPKDTALTPHALERFLGDFVDGKLAPTVVSEPAPADPVRDGVTTLVGTTFLEAVGNKAVGVFLAFTRKSHAGHARVLEETAQLAKHFTDVNPLRDLVVAVIDLENNSIPGRYRGEAIPGFGFVVKGTGEYRIWTPGADKDLGPRPVDLQEFVLRHHGMNGK